MIRGEGMDSLIAYILAKKYAKQQGDSAKAYADEVGRRVEEAGFKVQVEQDRSILEGEGQVKILYLIPKESEDPSDGYDEYVYANNTWEWIGHTDIDLSDYATKEELNAIKPTYKPFPASWSTAATNTTKYFCNVVDTDSNASKGMAFLGELSCSDFSASGVPIGNGEAVVEVIADNGSNGKVIHIVLTSGDTSPYRWEYTYWNKGSNTSGWIAFATSANLQTKENTSNKVTSLSVNSTDDEYPSAKCVYDMIGNIESALEALL